MQTEEERIKQFLDKHGLVSWWFNDLLKEYSRGGLNVSLPGDRSKWLKMFKKDLAESGIPEKDISYWAENLLLYLEYRLKEESVLGGLDSDENFKWYKEKTKHERTKFYLGLGLFIAVIVIYTLIWG